LDAHRGLLARNDTYAKAALLSVITMLILVASSYVRRGDPIHHALLVCVLVLLIAQAALFVIVAVLGNVHRK